MVEDYHTYYVGGTSVPVHNKCIVNENGVRVEVRKSNEHGLPHARIFRNGPNKTIGLNKIPMRGHPNLSAKQTKVISKKGEIINDAIEKFFPKA